MKQLFSYFLLLGLLIPVACVDLDFDEPPPGGEPVDITANATIQQLKAWFVPGEFTDITDDLIIRGIVIADDASGNYYKTIVIQDETAGIEVKLNSVGLANDYPIGREIFIRCRGLVISDYNGLIQLGGGTYDDGGQDRLAGIEEALLKDFIVAGQRDQFVTPKVKLIKEINTNDLSTLIRLADVQFISSDAGQTYADPVTQFSVNHLIEDCAGDEVILRTSGYADFAGATTPQGNGSLVAIVGVFGSDLQLAIRDQNDVQMDQARCGQGGVTPNGTIADLRALYQAGSFTTITQDLIVRGVVNMDDASGNYYKTIVIQDETGGIEVKINEVDLANDFPVGREVFLKCKDLLIGDYFGLIQVGGGTYTDNGGNLRLGGIEPSAISSHVIPGQSGQALVPLTRTIDQLSLNDMSQLIRLEGVQFTDADAGKTYADAVGLFSVNLNLEDCDDNTIILRTSGYADFAGNATPNGKGTITAVLGVYNGDLQLFIRNTQDVSMTGNRCDGGGPTPGDIDEDFETVGNNADVALSGWLNVATKGTRVWRGKTFSGNTYVQATAFNDTEPEMETWLITPAIDLSVDKKLSFRSSVAFWVHNGGSVLISTNFDGANIGGASWTSLGAQLPNSSTVNYDWVESGDVDLSGYTGTGYIAFVYNGSGPGGQTTTFIIDDVLVQDK
ncbi:MAG: choice-of-anchor J domain-containing protein [Lewinellaceae bacterium]|nr:choice-of-anchor J domain-containing protein [Saprospiraceae bacterium]MCB9311221.1 choice-of-anchor J domain-containing protein [Lewinellaceae bacterium]